MSELTSGPLSSAAAPDPETWVDAHGDMLYRYALQRVRAPDVAEELVQETFMAALRSVDKFEGRSKVQTWLTGILRHKILDYYRKRSRHITEPEGGGHADYLDDLFDEKGRWLHYPDPKTVDPKDLLEREEFWAVFEGCLDSLSPRHREAFARRIMEDEDTEVICKAMAVSATNLWVMLFRARTKMRRCLTLGWFQRAEDGRTTGDAQP